MSSEIPSFNKTENKEQSQEIKRFTFEQVEEVNKKLSELSRKLRDKGYRNGHLSLTLKDYDGETRRFGIGGGMGYDATAFIPDQVVAALALADYDFDKEEVFDFSDEKLSKPLVGLKILDLGCGVEPEFSYIARRLGAEMWTVDVVPASEFEPLEVNDDGESIDENASAFHIQVDLNSPDAVRTILEKAHGRFNFVTEAHLSTGTTRTVDGRREDYAAYGQEIAKEILIDEGVYQKVDPFTPQVQHVSSLKY